MGSRLQLQGEFEEILGSTNVYYQPPASVKLKYPCIIYELDPTYIRRADNRLYISMNRYHVKHLFKSLENEKKDVLINHFRMMTHDNRMTADGLYNDDFTLYY